MLKLGVLLAATMLAVAAPRENAAATDLYLFPIGVMAGMATMVVRALVETMTGTPDDGRLAAGAVAIAVLLFPAIGGLAARGRNGFARLLLILALCFAYIASYTPLTVALFAGYLALSFCDLGFVAHRAGIELGRGRAHPAVAAHPRACADRRRLDLPRAARLSARALSVALGGGGHFHPR